MQEWVWFQEEPTIASAPYAYYCVYRVAKEHVKVMLSGNGGDELLAGYIPYFRAYLDLCARPGALARGGAGAASAGARPLSRVLRRSAARSAAAPRAGC